jgi:hypothetical protein
MDNNIPFYITMTWSQNKDGFQIPENLKSTNASIKKKFTKEVSSVHIYI